jgi:hypothetical protein
VIGPPVPIPADWSRKKEGALDGLRDNCRTSKLFGGNGVLKSKLRKDALVMVPLVTAKEFLITSRSSTGTEMGRTKSGKADGRERMMTAVAGPVALSIKPSIAPMTVPGVPLRKKLGSLVKEKTKVSA